MDTRLVSLDGLAIAVILIIGLIRHHGPAVLYRPFYVSETLLPFMIGWFGLYAIDRRFSQATTHWWRFVRLAGAVLIGGLLRATEWVHGGAGPTFLLVVFATGLAGLLITTVVWKIVPGE